MAEYLRGKRNPLTGRYGLCRVLCAVSVCTPGAATNRIRCPALPRVLCALCCATHISPSCTVSKRACNAFRLTRCLCHGSDNECCHFPQAIRDPAPGLASRELGLISCSYATLRRAAKGRHGHALGAAADLPPPRPKAPIRIHLEERPGALGGPYAPAGAAAAVCGVLRESRAAGHLDGRGGSGGVLSR